MNQNMGNIYKNYFEKIKNFDFKIFNEIYL